ncbi:hypothetical protein EJ08DRAFT_337004 [Tothia fuscella]|uniref:Uncharacterized protein n=1 Tax=Tothia fuscella TaxID=1048955 RepID=A0A9P4P189_9PEZI|nr:hypothetical protein EJ08DRAFT_337004 [Tothia fuscella]
MTTNMTAHTADLGPEVSVLCSYPVSDIYNYQHRYVYYAALAFIALAPKHKWMTPASLALVGVYTIFSILYAVVLFIAPTRVGPTLDIFPIHSILLTNTYAMAAVVFCRSELVRPRRHWARCSRMFAWLSAGFFLATLDKMAFEKLAKKVTKTVQCFADNSTSLPVNPFSVGHGLACQNPCAFNGASSLIMHPAQDEIRPILWGTLDAVTKTFADIPTPNMSTQEHLIVILCAVALSSTLWLNFATSPQITRNTVFAIFTRGRKESRVRVAIAKVLALAWFGWSWLAMLAIALSLPGVTWVQESLLERYPVAHTMCIGKQWAPWVFAMAVVLLRVAVFRHKRQEAIKSKQARRARMTRVMDSLRMAVESAPLLPAHHPSSDGTIETNFQEEPVSSIQQTQSTVTKHRIDIVEIRKINGFIDGFVELGEWWNNPHGEEKTDSAQLPSADEEKALLQDHYNGMK